MNGAAWAILGMLFGYVLRVYLEWRLMLRTLCVCGHSRAFHLGKCDACECRYFYKGKDQ